jgi:hypothetical protein
MPGGVLHLGLMLTEMKQWLAVKYFLLFVVFIGKSRGFQWQIMR